MFVYLEYWTLNLPLMVYPKVLFGVDIHRSIQCLASEGLLEAGNMRQTSIEEALRAAGALLTSASESRSGSSRVAGTAVSNACSWLTAV